MKNAKFSKNRIGNNKPTNEIGQNIVGLTNGDK